MVITLTVIGVLLAIAVPSFRQMILTQGVKNASFDLYSALVYARSEAIKTNDETATKVITLCAGNTTANNGVWTTGWRIVSGTCVAGSLLRSWTPSSNVTVSQTVSGATPVKFARSGHLLTTAPKLQVDPASSMTGVDSRCIQIDLIGRPRTQLGTCP